MEAWVVLFLLWVSPYVGGASGGAVYKLNHEGAFNLGKYARMHTRVHTDIHKYKNFTIKTLELKSISSNPMGP